jgi:hypothetical protein
MREHLSERRSVVVSIREFRIIRFWQVFPDFPQLLTQILGQYVKIGKYIFRTTLFTTILHFDVV